MNPEATGPQEGVSPVVPPTEPAPPVPIPPGLLMAIGIQTGSVSPQLLEKVTPEHITSMLESNENESKRKHELAIKQLEGRERDRQSQRETDRMRERSLLFFAGGVLAFVLAVTLILLRYGQADLIKILVPAILSSVLAFAAGMGYQRSRQ